ncbi:MAG: DUF4314 domain-containing protein [Candidatus Cryptobacteroides sp.]
MRKVKIGDTIRIIRMDDAGGRDTQAVKYAGRTGTVEFIDSIGQLHGTWGGLAIIPEVDEFELQNRKT